MTREVRKALEDLIDELVTERDALRTALNLALCRLLVDEPDDSRAVSDEFVAMAAVESGVFDDGILAVIQSALIRERVPFPPEVAIEAA